MKFQFDFTFCESSLNFVIIERKFGAYLVRLQIKGNNFEAIIKLLEHILLESERKNRMLKTPFFSTFSYSIFIMNE